MFNFPIFSVVIAIILTYTPHFLKVALLKKVGKYDNRNPRAHEDHNSSVPEAYRGVPERLAACHNNQLEMLGVYAASVAVNVALNPSTPTTFFVVCTALYVSFRALYVIAYAGPQIADGYLRSLAFGGCIGSMVTLWVYAAFRQ